MKKDELGGKVVVITGGASGLGRAAALLFAAQGARVSIGDTDAIGGADVAGQVDQGGGEALYVETDVRSSSDVQILLGKTKTRWGRIDVLYASAGVVSSGAAWETEDQEFMRVIDINLGGCFRLLKFGVPLLAQGGGGTVVLTASELGLTGIRGAAAYCASKAGVVNLTRAAAADASPLNVRVNCLCPGPADTPMMSGWVDTSSNPGLGAAQLEPILMQRLGRPEEIANAALFLASDQSSFLTGSILVADGGTTCWYRL